MGAHGSKEKLYRSSSEKYPSKLPVPSDKKYKIAVNRERFGSFGARGELYSKKLRLYCKTVFFTFLSICW